MNRALFGTDGIRGKAGAYPLDNTTVIRIGSAIGTHFSKAGEYILIGHDPRESSPQIVAALAAGLTAAGTNVKTAGGLPTPGLAYLTAKTDAAAGIVVTASHNPYQDNGIKVFTREGNKLSDEAETALNAEIEKGVFRRGTGRVEQDNALLRRYEDFVVESAGSMRFSGLQLALDSANGATSGIAERIFRRLGVLPVILSDQPNGRNINQDCGAAHPEALKRTVLEKSLNLGAAFDGDGDRLIFVDEQGRECTGDHILYILAVTGGHKGVVATVMSNMGLEIALQAKGIQMHRTQVGDRYVLEGLERTGLKLGGEQSGHFVLWDLLQTGDGMLAAVQVIRALQDSGRSLAQWRDEVSLLPQALVNIPLSNKALIADNRVQAFIAQKTAELAGQGRILIRPSGTEPLLRVMAEAPSAQSVAELAANELEQLLKSLQDT